MREAGIGQHLSLYFFVRLVYPVGIRRDRHIAEIIDVGSAHNHVGMGVHICHLFFEACTMRHIVGIHPGHVAPPALAQANVKRFRQADVFGITDYVYPSVARG